MDASRATSCGGLVGLFLVGLFLVGLFLVVLEADVAVFSLVAGLDEGLLLSHATKNPEQSNNPVSVMVFRERSAGAIRLTRQGYG
jgi:hypothetical protein